MKTKRYRFELEDGKDIERDMTGEQRNLFSIRDNDNTYFCAGGYGCESCVFAAVDCSKTIRVNEIKNIICLDDEKEGYPLNLRDLKIGESYYANNCSSPIEIKEDGEVGFYFENNVARKLWQSLRLNINYKFKLIPKKKEHTISCTDDQYEKVKELLR